LRVTDFGLSKFIDEKEKEKKTKEEEAEHQKKDFTLSRTMTFCGTLEYMAPEMMRNMTYSTSVDWFSFGILLFEMLSGKNPLKNDR